MLYKPRYLHQALRGSEFPTNGYSVLMLPVLDDHGGQVSNLVDVKATICSKEDQFTRAGARAYLNTKEGTIILVSQLPQYLAKLDALACGFKLKTKQQMRAHANRFAWLWKYFL